MKPGDVMSLVGTVTHKGRDGLRIGYSFKKNRALIVLVLGAEDLAGDAIDPETVLNRLGWVKDPTQWPTEAKGGQP